MVFKRRARLLASQRRFAEALADLDSALSALPKELDLDQREAANIRFFRGSYLMEVGRYREAKADLDFSLSVRDLAYYRTERATWFVRRRQPAAAVADCEQALRIRKDDLLAHWWRAQAHLMREDLGAATSDLERVRSLSKMDSGCLELGQAQLLAGDVAAYRKNCQQVLEAARRRTGASLPTPWLYLLLLADQPIGGEGSLADVARRMPVPDDVNERTRLEGLLAFRLRDDARAKVLFLRSLNTLAPDEWDNAIVPWLFLSMLESRAGKGDEAKQWLGLADRRMASYLARYQRSDCLPSNQVAFLFILLWRIEAAAHLSDITKGAAGAR